MNRRIPWLTAIILTGSSTTALAVADTPTITKVDVDPIILDTVRTQLPEAKAVDPAFLNTDYDTHLSLNQDAQVSVTFLDEGAGYKNSLGYFTFENGAFDGLTKGDIDLDNSGIISLNELGKVDGVDYGWVFPNASEYRGGGSLLPGDTVQLGDGEILSAGTNVSFFLAQNSWTKYGISDGAYTGQDQVMYGLDFLNPETDFTATVDSSLQKSRHIALLFNDEQQEEVIMGFEDLNRIDRSLNDYGYRSDEDFNDAVFMVTSNPADAFGDSNIATAPLPKLDKGVPGAMMLAGLLGVAFSSRKKEDKS